MRAPHRDRAVARLACALLLGGSLPAELDAFGIDLEALAAARLSGEAAA